MEKKIKREIRRLILEVSLVIVFTIVTLPLWDYVDNKTLADVANHYSEIEEGKINVTNKVNRIYSSSFEESIEEYRYAMITSLENESTEYTLYLTMDLMYNYNNIYISDGKTVYKLSDLLVATTDRYYFEIYKGNINSKETNSIYYYVWSKDIKNDKNIKMKFIAK